VTRTETLLGRNPVTPRIALPLFAALLVLLGSGLAAQSLHRAANAALARVTEERLRGAGATAARTLEMPGMTAAQPWLRAVMEANGLEGAFIVGPDLVVLADATGPTGSRVDLLRVDVPKVRRALAGESTVALGWELGETKVATAYLPLKGPRGSVDRVLLLEGGEAMARRQKDLDRALVLAWILSAFAALAIAALTGQWVRTEGRRQALVARAAQGEAIARLGAMVAHEIRNPLTVISGNIELMRERDRGRLTRRDTEALDDFLDLSAERPLSGACIEVGPLLQEAARPWQENGLAVEVTAPGGLRLFGDYRRLRQVLLNLLVNAAQAGARRVQMQATADRGRVRVEVRDDGKGIPSAVRKRLFEPFVSSKPRGTGLGLVVSRRIVERQGGTLALLSGEARKTAFCIELPQPIEEKR